MKDVYLPVENYNAAIEATLALEPCPFTGKITRDQIEIALGEIAGLWPMRIRRDAILSGVRETESIHDGGNVYQVEFGVAR